ncbi:DUF2971 domain-containing protein [Treponema zuelzerae]|uniref:DUF2971 domain-containing protein n=1 Tax=Teretinema zuelzerae TaxID=156 RepID=A0AAE3EMQ7_9SPIR|nr:DUF2971 domain-containing protein [Teretinema zuelzerae]MCD1656119.1 DUF2971 domain-containing protein [Teretinema zuelzerae]
MKLYKYYSNYDFVEETITKNTLYFSSVEKFNDPYESICNINYKNKTHTMIPNPKMFGNVCCFCQKPDNYLLWSHYADNHRGFCIEYEFDKIRLTKEKRYESLINSNKYVVGKVKYQKDALKCNKLPSMEYSDNLCNLFFHKFPMWKYENEVRIVLFNSKINKITLPNTKITKVFFGKNCDKKYMIRILHIINFNQLKIDLYHLDYHLKGNRMIVFQRPLDWYFEE